MTKTPATASVTSSVADVVAKLYELDVRHLPIVDGSRLVGIVSDRDVKAFFVTSVEPEEVRTFQRQLATPIVEFMASDLITVTSETEVSEAIDLMIDQRIGAIPVVDDETGDLTGIVSYVDVLRGLQSLL